jgi:hypothetical protein
MRDVTAGPHCRGGSLRGGGIRNGRRASSAAAPMPVFHCGCHRQWPLAQARVRTGSHLASGAAAGDADMPVLT